MASGADGTGQRTGGGIVKGRLGLGRPLGGVLPEGFLGGAGRRGGDRRDCSHSDRAGAAVRQALVSDVVLVALIAAAPGCMAAVMSFANNIIARHNAERIDRTVKAMETLEKNTNSIKDALVKVTGESEFAKGLKQGQGERK